MPPGGQGGRNFQWNFNVNQKDLDRLKQTMGELAKQSQSMTDAQTKFNDVLQKGFQPPKGANAGSAAGGQSGVAGVFGGEGAMLAVFGPQGAIAAGAMQVAATFRQISNEMVRLAGVFNPAVVRQFDLAWQMVQATIGRRLVPVVQFFTEVLRGVADVLANVLPGADDVRNALSPLREVFRELKQAFLDVAPLMKAVLVEGIRLAAFSLRLFVGVFSPFIDALRVAGRFFGTPGAATSKGDMPGMPAKFTGLEDISREMAKQFLDYTYGAGKKDPQEETVDRLKAIDEFLEQVVRPAVDAFMAGKQSVEAGGEAVWAAIKGMTLGAFG